MPCSLPVAASTKRGYTHQRLTEAGSFELQAGAAEQVLEGRRAFNEG